VPQANRPTELELIQIVREMMLDKDQKTTDRLRAVSMLWDRSNPVATKHQIEVKHTLSVEETEIEHFRALKRMGASENAFLDRFGINGLPRVRALVEAEDGKVESMGEIIEGEAEEVPIDDITPSPVEEEYLDD
jgi:hypothetical protein